MSNATADEPRRVLVLIKGLGIGGSERLIAESAPVWDTNLFEYRVAYFLPWKDQLVPSLADAGYDAVCLGGRRGLDVFAPVRLRREIRESKPDLIHIHSPSVAVMARSITRTPIVYTEHNVTSSYRQPTQALNRITYGRNSAVTAVSTPVAESLGSYPGPAPRVIENGVAVTPPDQDTVAVRSELGLDAPDPLVVHVGNIRPHKGHANLIASTVHLKAARPDISVVSIGGEKYEGDLARVQGMAKEAGVDDVIRFLGRKPDARPYLAAADVVVNPSDFEGLPVALLEALALGRPVVATDVGGVSSVVVDGETGRLVQPKDPEELAEAVIEAITNPDSKSWGQAGRELVASEHGIDRMVGEFESIYRQVLGV